MSATGVVIGGVVGGLMGLGLINVMAAMAKGKNNPWDVVTLPARDDIAGTVASWAAAHGYRLVRTEGRTQVYKKGVNFLTAPMFLESTEDGAQHVFKAYTQIDGLLLKGNLALTADGIMARLPRSMAKKAVNNLLTTLQQPLLA
ncbi:MAG: hypothetical protein WAZ48_00975 [Lysobacteraceae bacterium]